MLKSNCWGDDNYYDFVTIVAELKRLLKIDSTLVAMKRFVDVNAVKNLPHAIHPSGDKKFAFDQLVGRSRWLNQTIVATTDNLVGNQCSTVIGLSPRNETFLSGKKMAGIWFASEADAALHQQAMTCANENSEQGERYQAVVVTPLLSATIDNPDICLLYARPGQMILLINALQWSGYKKLNFSCVGESACADSWGAALQTGEPSLSIPCFAERKFGGVKDDELLIALAPSYLPKIVTGLNALYKNGLRYPIQEYGLERSPQDLLEKIYDPQ